jgi:hypothetical protein
MVEVQVTLEFVLQEVGCSGFQECFEQVYTCWQKYVAAKILYFEGTFIQGKGEKTVAHTIHIFFWFPGQA